MAHPTEGNYFVTPIDLLLFTRYILVDLPPPSLIHSPNYQALNPTRLLNPESHPNKSKYQPKCHPEQPPRTLPQDPSPQAARPRRRRRRRTRTWGRTSPACLTSRVRSGSNLHVSLSALKLLNLDWGTGKGTDGFQQPKEPSAEQRKRLAGRWTRRARLASSSRRRGALGARCRI
jgi:hypothetical protein